MIILRSEIWLAEPVNSCILYWMHKVDYCFHLQFDQMEIEELFAANINNQIIT